MEDKIKSRLRDLEEERGIHIINARERGSRMLGVEHDDSDWDVMFLFAEDCEKYAQISGHTESIHKPDDPIDLHGWNVDKFGRLLADSNPNAIEYCRVGAKEYISWYGLFDAVAAEARDNFNHMALYYHYISMGKSNYEKYVASGNDCTRGRQFYVMRAVAMARYIRIEGKLPPMNVYDLLDDSLDVLSDEEHDKLLWLADQKSLGRGDLDKPDIVGSFYEAESDAEIEPTDERISSPDKTIIDEFIGETIVR